MSEAKQILQLIPKVMGDIGVIGKGQTNQFHKYKFRGIDDALNHFGPILQKHGITPQYKESGASLNNPGTGTNAKGDMRFHAVLKSHLLLYAPDGSFIEHEAYGEAMDTNGDKAVNKARAAALKYILFFGFMVPVESGAVDDADADDNTKPFQQQAPLQNQQRRQHNGPQQQQRGPSQNQNRPNQQRSQNQR